MVQITTEFGRICLSTSHVGPASSSLP